MTETPDHDFILAGSSQQNATGDYFAYAVRVNDRGDILWKKYFDNNLPNYGTRIIRSPAGYVIVSTSVAYTTTVDIVDDSGNFVSQLVQDSVWLATSMDITLDKNGLIISASKEQKNSQLMDFVLEKTDLYGVIQWSKQYGLPDENEIPFKVLQMGDGGFLIMGSTTELSDFPHYENILIIKTDVNGEVVWKKIYGGSVEQNVAYDMVETDDGGYLLICFNNGIPELFEVIKIDVDGNVLMDKPIEAPIVGLPRSVSGVSNGDFVVAGEYFNTEPRMSLFWRISSTGELLWQREYIPNSAGFAVIKTADGNFLGSGGFNHEGDIDFYLLKMGNDGCMLNELALSKDTVSCTSPVKLSAQTGYDDYQWNNGVDGRSILVDTSGLYIVNGATKDNCHRSDTIQVTIKDCFLIDHCKNITYTKKEIDIPNVFTPNGDKLNEFFVVPDPLIGSKFSVYNHWGSLVYSNDKYDNTWSGGDVASGVYYYTLTNACMDKSFKGTISIFK